MWFGGCVECAEEVKTGGISHALRRAAEVDVEGRKPSGRPKKTWRQCVPEDMRRMNNREERVHNHCGRD